jgi:hypothetical protein
MTNASYSFFFNFVSSLQVKQLRSLSCSKIKYYFKRSLFFFVVFVSISFSSVSYNDQNGAVTSNKLKKRKNIKISSSIRVLLIAAAAAASTTTTTETKALIRKQFSAYNKTINYFDVLFSINLFFFSFYSIKFLIPLSTYLSFDKLCKLWSN